MNKTSLETAFNSYFHNKHSFRDFLNININNEYTQIFYSKNTFSPSKKLKQFQQFLNLFIFDHLNINKDVVFSYRKGVSTIDAIKPHKNKKFIYTTDIQSFFTHIETEKIKHIILENKNNYIILEEDIEKYIDNILSLVTYKNVLPIGAPTSPKISNAYLLKLDNLVQEYCEKNEIIFTRYSDDFIFSSDSKEKLINLDDILEGSLEKSEYLNLTINRKKTKLQRQGSNITLLGLTITPQGHITVNKKIKNDLEILLHFYLTDKSKFNDVFENNYSSKIEKVSGVISHINSIDKTYVSKLRKKYGSYIVNSFIHRDISYE
ncbi:MAG: reverse transcriptase domain-containing protein [Arcobacter sp.]|uniref:reverse transcriptase domain-containing protein n=1 Tax=Arcobacter sp. TaxID=1872629 RepID=UPI003AFFFD82